MDSTYEFCLKYVDLIYTMLPLNSYKKLMRDKTFYCNICRFYVKLCLQSIQMIVVTLKSNEGIYDVV